MIRTSVDEISHAIAALHAAVARNRDEGTAVKLNEIIEQLQRIKEGIVLSRTSADLSKMAQDAFDEANRKAEK